VRKPLRERLALAGNLIYFSFVPLTLAGYVDIRPPIARSLDNIEAIVAVMRRLMLLRHAKTERGEDDRNRKLTKRGRGDASVIGAYMAQHGLVPDLAIVSPARRAQETWKILAAAFFGTPRDVNDERIYDASPEALIAIISETRQAQSLLVVGHNPGLHDVAVQLIASGDPEARERVSENMPTSGLVVIDIAFDDWSLLRPNPNAGRLECFVTPRLIAAKAN